MPELLRATVPESERGERLDAYLSRAFPLSRSAAGRLLESGCVCVTPGKAEKTIGLRAENR